MAGLGLSHMVQQGCRCTRPPSPVLTVPIVTTAVYQTSLTNNGIN